jgi:hypothetical protein
MIWPDAIVGKKRDGLACFFFFFFFFDYSFPAPATGKFKRRIYARTTMDRASDCDRWISLLARLTFFSRIFVFIFAGCSAVRPYLYMGLSLSPVSLFYWPIYILEYVVDVDLLLLLLLL